MHIYVDSSELSGLKKKHRNLRGKSGEGKWGRIGEWIHGGWI